MPLSPWSPADGVALDRFQQLPATILEPWIAVLERFGEANLLRIVATGSWTPLEGMPSCGPDGLVGLSYPDTGLILPDCGVGALIGRIGGSSASLQAAAADPAVTGETKPFPIGACCILRLPATAIGPLFIGFNTLRRPVTVASLTLSIETARGP